MCLIDSMLNLLPSQAVLWVGRLHGIVLELCMSPGHGCKEWQQILGDSPEQVYTAVSDGLDFTLLYRVALPGGSVLPDAADVILPIPHSSTGVPCQELVSGPLVIAPRWHTASCQQLLLIAARIQDIGKSQQQIAI